MCARARALSLSLSLFLSLLLDDETSHTAFDHQKKYLLNNWSWNEDELDDLEAQNKNNAVTRRGMHKILNDWKKKFDLNNTAHGI